MKTTNTQSDKICYSQVPYSFQVLHLRDQSFVLGGTFVPLNLSGAESLVKLSMSGIHVRMPPWENLIVICIDYLVFSCLCVLQAGLPGDAPNIGPI